MARDEDFKERRRREEREAERAVEDAAAQTRRQNPGPGTTSLPGAVAGGGDPADAVRELLTQIPPALEQLDALYRMYLMGVEKRPPVERRTWVDAAAARLLSLAKTTPALKFQAQSLHASYVTHRDLWEKMLRQKELK